MEKQLLKLTKDNYYSQEADKQYMSVSQVKAFMRCEAAALAKLNSKYTEPKSDALLFGSYVHSWLDGTIEEFKDENPDLFSSRGKSKGELKSQYQNANLMIEVLKEDPFCMMALEGDKEVIMTGTLHGHPFKIRIDVYNPLQNRFADLKTVKDIRGKHWVDEVGWCSFVEAYGYVTQMAVYSEIERQNRGGDYLENYIVAVSKETPPDKAVITVDRERIQLELEYLESRVGRIGRLKAGQETAKRCENCWHCRRTKKVTSVTHYMDLI
ncbi:PD-(D/E)XK nuclease-like domain-containing protein [Rossellomorea marisflavi]|uniref:PD-(D/E)XK nuclease-like domain-containing protein n=1 Tax=Rossellomorea marisflavi TaxID=189381 RepID=UPI00345C7310